MKLSLNLSIILSSFLLLSIISQISACSKRSVEFGTDCDKSSSEESDYDDDDEIEDYIYTPSKSDEVLIFSSEEKKESGEKKDEGDAALEDIKYLFGSGEKSAENKISSETANENHSAVVPSENDKYETDNVEETAPKANSGENEAVAPSADESSRKKRDASDDEFQRTALRLFNEYRRKNRLPLLTADPKLTSGAQSWAEYEASNFKMSHSCTNCYEYSEVLARKRMTRNNLPSGAKAAQWIYDTWAGDEDDTYATLLKDPKITKVGFGLKSRKENDKSYHLYAVGRFARS